MWACLRGGCHRPRPGYGQRVRYQFVDCRWELGAPQRGRELYLAGHVPGASFLDVDEDLADLSALGQGRHPLPSAERFAAAASRAGIGLGVTVVMEAMARHHGEPLAGATVAIQGFGNVGTALARTAAELGMQVVAVSNWREGRYRAGGFTAAELTHALRAALTAAVSRSVSA